MESKIWQTKLEDACREWNIPAPVFHIYSDQRGGRTAWSSAVTVFGKSLQARFWYDGKYINNAKEDAAEVALKRMGYCPSSGSNSGSPSTSASSPTTSPRY
ncbi:hypothetical protein VTK26DRAFT_9195 [Humicola hyalothermophila]